MDTELLEDLAALLVSINAALERQTHAMERIAQAAEAVMELAREATDAYLDEGGGEE
jgi:hypothetical protein